MERKSLFYSDRGIAFIFLWILFQIASAQNIDVGGSVKVVSGVPLIGVTIQVKGESVGTVTDIDGALVGKITCINSRQADGRPET